MALKKYKLGDLLTVSDEKNINNKYTVSDVKGISNQKMFIETKADMTGVSLTPYLLVKPDFFAYVPTTSRNGNKITIAYNSTSNTYIVSSSYIIFYVKDKSILLSDYLFMYFNRPEFDRYARFNSWGSARETFDWSEMCDIDIELPSIEIQQKYVNVYKAMVANQKAYEKGLDDLKLVCDAYIENLRKTTPCEEIGKYITKTPKNSDEKITTVLGVGQNGFIKPQKKPNESLKNYKILCDKCICYAPPLYNIQSDAIHYYDKKEVAVCSPIYESFTCDETNLLAKYLILWLKRSEFKRYTAFHSGGVRNTFDYDLMEQVKIPIPSIEIQEAIADIYIVYWTRRNINEKLKMQIKNLCPILIAGAINEAKKEV